MWIALLAWAFSSPVGASPDEDFHQINIYCSGASIDTKCKAGGERYGHCYSMRPSVPADCGNYSNLSFPKSNDINSNQYPPVYYETMNWLVSDTVGRTTIYVRIANTTIAMFFLFFSVYFSHARLKITVLVSWVIASMPLGLYMIASINPTAWILISISSLWGPLWTFLNFKQYKYKSIRNLISHYKLSELLFFIARILFILLCFFLGFGSRNEAILWIPLTIFILIIANIISEKDSFFIKIFSKKILILSVVLLIFIFILFYTKILKFQQFNVFYEFFYKIFLSDLNFFRWELVQETFNVVLGITGLSGVPTSGLGTHDVPIPGMAIVFIFYSLSACFLLGFSEVNNRKLKIIYLITLIMIFIIIMLVIQRGGDYLQSRYILPMLYVYLGILLLPTNSNIYGNTQQWISIFFSLTIANSISLLSTSLRFIYGVIYQKTRYPLNQNAEDINPNRLYTADIPGWWLLDYPFNPFIIWLIGSFSFGLSMFFLLKWIQSHKLVVSNCK